MNNDLISRSALKKHKITTTIYNGIEPENIEVVPVASIDNAPTIEVPHEDNIWADGYECGQKARPTGHWREIHTKTDLGYGKIYYQHEKCSCDIYVSPYKFCPNCGADMRGGKE